MDPGGGRSFLNLCSIKGSRPHTGNGVLELEVPTPSQLYIQWHHHKNQQMLQIRYFLRQFLNVCQHTADLRAGRPWKWTHQAMNWACPVTSHTSCPLFPPSALFQPFRPPCPSSTRPAVLLPPGFHTCWPSLPDICRPGSLMAFGLHGHICPALPVPPTPSL